MDSVQDAILTIVTLMYSLSQSVSGQGKADVFRYCNAALSAVTVLGSLKRTLGNYIGSYNGYTRAILGNCRSLD